MASLMMEEGNQASRTELDSHANMPVVGRNALIVADLETIVDVSPFSPDYPTMKAKMVDAAIKYVCPKSGEEYILLVDNAIYVPTMQHNLIPPFVMREAGITVNDTAKIHMESPSNEDHALVFPETGFVIKLSLIGVFSYFSSSKPSADDFNTIDGVYKLTPDRWNPHCDSYSTNEEQMRDVDGDMIERRQRNPVLLETEEGIQASFSSLQVGKVESEWIDQVFETREKPSEENAP
jgi:hypothetical protein